MVRLTFSLLRVPVIKFRKGGAPRATGAATPASSASCPASAAPTTAQQHSSISSMRKGPINDIDLPLRYRRQPLSQEEIDHINGGGIV